MILTPNLYMLWKAFCLAKDSQARNSLRWSHAIGAAVSLYDWASVIILLILAWGLARLKRNKDGDDQ